MPKTEKYENTPEGLFEPEKQLQQEGMILFEFWWFKVPLLKTSLSNLTIKKAFS